MIDYWFVLKDLMIAMNQPDMVSTAYIVSKTNGYAPEFKAYCEGWIDGIGLVASESVGDDLDCSMDCGEAAGVDGD